MDTIWFVLTGITFSFEFFGFGLLVLWIITMIFNPGNPRVDKIRRYMLMQDEEEL